MTTQSMFSFINQSEIEAIKKIGTHHIFQPGDIIVQNGKYIKVIPFVIKGTIKVLRVDDDGNELFLYYITPGQSCAVSLSTCLTERKSSIRAIAEEETELIAIPVAYATKWFNENTAWRSFVLQTMSFRFDELVRIVDNIAFSNIAERLAVLLSEKVKTLQTNIIHITHQEIANELSTSREVISRLLKQLEKRQKLKIFRSRVEIISLV